MQWYFFFGNIKTTTYDYQRDLTFGTQCSTVQVVDNLVKDLFHDALIADLQQVVTFSLKTILKDLLQNGFIQT